MGRRKKNEKKPRTRTFSAGFIGTSDKIQIMADSNGALIMQSKAGILPLIDKQMWSGYDRPKGEKKLNYFTDAITNDPNKEIFIRYNQVYGIDTNSKFYKGKLYVLGVLTKAEIIETDEHGGKISCSIKQIMSWIYDAQEENLEQQSWWYACEYILRECAIYSNPNVALVVDCDLGNILRYNKRELPIVEDKFLPPKIQLVYGSADSGKEFVPNNIISYTDKKATEYLDRLIKGELQSL